MLRPPARATLATALSIASNIGVDVLGVVGYAAAIVLALSPPDDDDTRTLWLRWKSVLVVVLIVLIILKHVFAEFRARRLPEEIPATRMRFMSTYI
jgi:hypothetical protein